ncbi:YncE family protein [Synechococcus sp. PCC 7336]|uniref:YncE family protein n=1 Tax=Synechococcus sp. PCC 7336 TaxID=195250 RepID=UPI0012EA0685|nr:YncE family protein [Synechococcus sp. PCC 7336]
MLHSSLQSCTAIAAALLLSFLPLSPLAAQSDSADPAESTGEVESDAANADGIEADATLDVEVEASTTEVSPNPAETVVGEGEAAEEEAAIAAESEALHCQIPESDGEAAAAAADSGEGEGEADVATVDSEGAEGGLADAECEIAAVEDESGLRAIQSIPLPSTADRIDTIVDGDRTLAVVGLLEEQAVATIDLATGDTVAKNRVGFAPHTVRYDPVNRLIYAAGFQSPGLLVMNADTLDIDKGYGLAAGILDIDFDAASRRIFVTHPSISSISVISLEEPQARSLPVPDPPLAIAFNPTSGNLFVTMQTANSLALLVLNADNGEPIALLRSGTNPEDIAIDPRTQRVVVLNSDSSDLTIINRSGSGEAIDTVGLNWEPTRLALSPDGSRAYVTSRNSNRLQVVNLEASQLEAVYPIGASPIGINYLPTADGPGLVVVEAGEPRLRWLSLPETPSETAIAAAASRPNTGSAAGRIVDLAGNPVSVGEIRLQSIGDLTPDLQLNLLPDGSFLISDLPEGVYLADIDVPGFPTVSSQLRVRTGFISSTRIQLPPGRPDEESQGIGVIPDREPFSDDLAAHVHAALAQKAADRDVELLIGPIGVWKEFQQLAPLVEGLDIIDRDNRFTEDLDRLKTIGNSLGLRYIVLTHMDISRDFDTRGNPFLNLAVRYFVPQVPINVPDFTPNDLRSRGVMIVVDLQEDEPGEVSRYFEAFGRDQVGGDRMFEDAAAGLFRRQAENMVPDLLEQWIESGSPLS